MSIRITPWPRGGFLVDIRWLDHAGESQRYRKIYKGPLADAEKWANLRRRYLEQHNGDVPEATPTAPTLAEFWPRFLTGYVQANRQKASEQRSKRSIWTNHLEPRFGSTPLDQVTTEAVQALKAALADPPKPERPRAPKTVNNILSVLRTMLQQAVKWKLIVSLPCEISEVENADQEMAYYDDEDFEAVVYAAKEISTVHYVAVLLAGDAGLRAGEIRGLRWRDVDLRHHQLRIQQAEWRGTVNAPKGWQMRRIPMTARLDAALSTHRHLKHERVLLWKGEPLTEKILQTIVTAAIGRARVAESARPVHRLRHTFGTRLASRGATEKQIQELMGHKHLTTTQRYMHLSPRGRDQAIRLLDAGIGTTPKAETQK